MTEERFKEVKRLLCESVDENGVIVWTAGLDKLMTREECDLAMWEIVWDGVWARPVW